MGNVISRNAGADRIIDAVVKTLNHAVARGGQIQTLAEGRLSALHSALVALDQQLSSAMSESDAAHAVLMARDNESDLEVGAVIDEIWNALGRPAQSIDYNLIVGSGKRAWTEGDPAKQPHLMSVLATNIRQTKHASLADKKEAWAVRIEQRAAAQTQAATPVDAFDARVSTLKMQRRTLASSAQVELTRLKRDFKNAGLTEAQVHEVIPDMPSTPLTVPPVSTTQPTNNAQSPATAQAGSATG